MNKREKKKYPCKVKKKRWIDRAEPIAGLGTMMGREREKTFGMDREKWPPAQPTTPFPSHSSGDSLPPFSQNEFARHDESCPPVFLSHWMNHCLGRPYAYEFNDLSKGPGRKLRKESLLVGLVVPPAVPGRASVQSCRFYLDMAQNEGVRPSVLKTKLSVHFGARSSVRSFTDDESPLAILYSSPPAVLFFPFGSAELSWVPLHSVGNA